VPSHPRLVVAGSKAQSTGLASRLHTHRHHGASDKFRIKIWDKATGEVIYDNQLGESDNADPTTALQGGSIVIHKAK
jgi:hypothetical protein